MDQKASCQCQSCKIDIEVDYVLLGNPITCPGCLITTVPTIPNGGPIPVSGYHLTFTEFICLLADVSSNEQMSDYLKNNFGFSLQKINDNWMIINSQNEAIDRLWLHLKIQQDKNLASDLYNLAMSIWRS
jgi:hypothetical protein